MSDVTRGLTCGLVADGNWYPRSAIRTTDGSSIATARGERAATRIPEYRVPLNVTPKRRDSAQSGTLRMTTGRRLGGWCETSGQC